MRAWRAAADAVLPAVAARLVRALGSTLDLDVAGEHLVAPFWAARRPVVYAAWHGQLLMLPFVNERLRRRTCARPVHVLASRSRDGERLARFCAGFGLLAIRGSSSRGGASALRALARAVRAGDDVALAPDGPRGPRAHVQPGAVMLARVTGAPLVPIAFSAQPSWRLPTWDGFEIPGPFGRAALVFGMPLSITRDADADLMRKELEVALAEVTTSAHAAVSRRTG